MIPIAEKVREILKSSGMRCSLTNARFVKPIDEEYITRASAEHQLIVTMEENVEQGSFGEAVRSFVDRKGLGSHVMTVAIPDEFVTHGKVDKLRSMLGIDAESVADRIKNYLSE